MNIRHFSIRFAAAALLAAAALTLTTPRHGANPTALVRDTGTATVVITPLTAEETAALKFMREEEKLARDVYDQLYKKWNLVTFQNIAASEQTHFDALGTLLTRYSVADPAQGLAAGVLLESQALRPLQRVDGERDQVRPGRARSGRADRKRTDIADLESAIKGTTKIDVKRVYTNLMNASFNHLEAFETGCELLGVSR